MEEGPGNNSTQSLIPDVIGMQSTGDKGNGALLLV